MELLYFSNISQLEHVEDSAPELLKQMRPITGDFIVAYELERRGIDYIDEWDFLTPEDIKKNCDTAYLLSRTWWNEYIEDTKSGGVCLADATKQDMIYPFEACLNARTVYDRLFSKYPIEKINGYFLPLLAVIRTGPSPARHAVGSVSQAILFHMAEKRGISINKFVFKHQSLLKTGIFGGIPVTPIEPPKFREQGSDQDKIILIYEDEMPRPGHAMIRQLFSKVPGVKTFSISQRVLQYARDLNNSQFGSVRRFQFFWDKFIESAKKYDGEYPEIFSNKYLLFQFERIRDEMETAADHGDFFSTFLDLLKPSLIVFGHEAFTLERTLVKLAQDRGIPTVGFIHGGLCSKAGFRGVAGDADSILVWNNMDIEFLTSYDVERKRLHKIGCIQYRDKYTKYVSNLEEDFYKSKSAAKKKLGLSPDNPLILLTTAQINTGFACLFSSPRKHREAIREILSLVKSRPDLQFAIKAHPSFDYYEFYGRLLRSDLPNLTFYNQGTLGEMLEASDICLLLNYCTTAALEAMLSRVPIVYLNSAVYPIPEWQEDSLSSAAICRVQTIHELEKQIDSLLTSQVAKDHALTEQDKLINGILDLSEVPAQNRLFDFIKHTIRDKQAGNAGLFLNTRNMHKMLFSKDFMEILSSKYLRLIPIDRKSSLKHFIYVIVYLAGMHNLGLGSIPRILKLFQNHFKNETVETWNKVRQLLLPAYITGSIYNLRCDESKLVTLRLFGCYLINPCQFFCMPSSFKRYLIKTFVKVMLGRSSVSFLCFVLNKMYYHFNFLTSMIKEIILRFVVRQQNEV